MGTVLSWVLTLVTLLLVSLVVYQVVAELKTSNAPPPPPQITVKHNPTPPSGISKTARKNARRKAKERALKDSKANEVRTTGQNEASTQRKTSLVSSVSVESEVKPLVQRPELTKTQLQKVKENNRRLLDSYRAHLAELQELREEKNRKTLTGNRFATTKDVVDEEDLEGYLSEDEIAEIHVQDLADVLKAKIQQIADAIKLEKEGSGPKAPKLPKASASTTPPSSSQPKKSRRGGGNKPNSATDAEFEQGWQMVPNAKKTPKHNTSTAYFASSKVDPDQFEYAPTASTLAAQEAARSAALPVGMTPEDAYLWKDDATLTQKAGGSTKKPNRRRAKKTQQYIPGLNA